MKKKELPRRNGSGIGFMRSRSVEPKLKNEIFHCYNGLGGSSRGVDGVYGGKNMVIFKKKYFSSRNRSGIGFMRC